MNHLIPIYRPFGFHTLMFCGLVVLLLIVGVATSYYPIYSVLFSYVFLIDFVYGIILLSNFMSKEKEYSEPRLSFNREGISVNSRLKYPWSNIRDVLYLGKSRRVTIQSTLTPRFEFIPELTHTLKYARLKIILKGHNRPSIDMKVPLHIHRFRKLLRRMERYAKACNSDTTFYLQKAMENIRPAT